METEFQSINYVFPKQLKITSHTAIKVGNVYNDKPKFEDEFMIGFLAVTKTFKLTNYLIHGQHRCIR